MVAVPELTHPGESTSNGLAELAVGVLEDQVRVLRTALQSHIKVPLTTGMPIVAWLVEHAAYGKITCIIRSSHELQGFAS